MNSNALNCFNKLILHGAFLLKLFSNYHQTSIDMNTKYEHYRVNVHFFFFHSSIFNFSSPSILTKKKKKKNIKGVFLSICQFPIYLFIYLYNSLHSSMKKVTSKIEAFPDSIFLIY